MGNLGAATAKATLTPPNANMTAWRLRAFESSVLVVPMAATNIAETNVAAVEIVRVWKMKDAAKCGYWH